MEFSKVVDDRVSIRWFKDDPIEGSTLRAIVEEAAKAPSWVNSQPWQVYVATGETLERIKADHWKYSQELVDPNPIIVPMSREDWGIRQQQNMADLYVGIQAMMQEKELAPETFSVANNKLFNAPAIVYMALPKGFSTWSVMDLGGFSYGLMLSAANRGIDSIPAYEFVRFPDLLAKHLGVDKDYDVVMGVGLGYRDNTPLNDWRCGRNAFEQYAKILK